MTATLYVESSAILAVLLESDGEVEALIRLAASRAASSLTLLEARRGLQRARSLGRLSADLHVAALRQLRAFGNRTQILGIDDSTIEAAGQQFPIEPVRSLEAIHLATALIWSGRVGPLTVASLDRHVRENAVALGLPVVP